MFGFMFAVLGSGIFWLVYFALNFVIGSVMIRHMAPKAFRWITTGKKPGDEFESVLGVVLIMIFWQVILAFLITYYALKIPLVYVVWPIFKQGVTATNKVIPDIKIIRN